MRTNTTGTRGNVIRGERLCPATPC